MCKNFFQKGERFVAVLAIPPVNSPRTAVQASVLNDVKKAKKIVAMPTKREMQEEIDRLRKQLKQHENLMMETGINR